MIKSRFLILSILILHFTTSKCQELPFNIDKYPFINYSKNKVSFKRDSLEFYSFFRKFDKLISTGKGKINIVHFGGSHIQADMWSGRLRTHFNQLIGVQKAARGWVYPFKMGHSKNNNPSNYSFDWTGRWEGCRAVFANCNSNFGMSAMQTTTNDSNASFTLNLKSVSDITYLFDRIKVFYEMNDNSFKISVNGENQPTQIIDNKKQGYTEFIFGKQLSQVTFSLSKNDSLQNYFRLFGMFTDLDAPGINYNAVGVNGASVPTYLKCNLMEEHLAVIQPDLIIFSVGINDAFSPDFCPTCYENNYSEWIKRIKRACPNVAIIFTTNTDSYKKNKKGRFAQNVTGLDVKIAMENLSYKHNAAVWDLFSVMGGLGSIKFWCKSGLANCSDLIHLSANGYYLLGDLFFVALIRKYEDYLKLPVAKTKHE